jgi:hypothetical protein
MHSIITDVWVMRQVTACERIRSLLELHSQGRAGAGTARRGTMVCRRKSEATQLGQHVHQWALFVAMTTMPYLWYLVPSGVWGKTLFSIGFWVKFIF